MKLIPIAIFLFIFNNILTGQQNLDIYVAQYTEFPNSDIHLKIRSPELVRLPLHNENILSFTIHSGIIYAKSYNIKDSTTTIWKYMYRSSIIRPLLSLKVKIPAFVATHNGMEYILRRHNNTYLLISVNGSEKIATVELQNDIQSVLYKNQQDRITVDNVHQLCLTHPEYHKFRLLSNKCDNKIYLKQDSLIVFIYKFSDQYWYLKEYDLEKKDSRIIVRMPVGVDNYCMTLSGNFISYDENHIYTFNPSLDIEWQQVFIPGINKNREVAWMRFLNDKTMFIAYKK